MLFYVAVVVQRLCQELFIAVVGIRDLDELPNTFSINEIQPVIHRGWLCALKTKEKGCYEICLCKIS